MTVVNRLAALVAMSAAFMGLGARASHAAPVLGGQIFSSGGNITVKILPSPGSAFTNEIFHVDAFPASILTSIGLDDATATPPKNLGPFVCPDEIIFAIQSPDGFFYMGPASRNADNVAHAFVDFTAPNTAIVSFEDLINGGDLNYADAIIEVTGAISATPTCVPEPGTLSLLTLGISGALVARRRRQAAQA